MSTYDLYLISPEISVMLLGILLILADLFIGKKRILPWMTVIGLFVSMGLALMLWFDISNDGRVDLFGVFDSSVDTTGVFGTLVVDKFSLFFKFLFIGVAVVITLMSTDYVNRFQRFQSEYYALILFSTSGMMLMASTLELISIYVALELTALPIAALASFNRDGKSSEAGLKFLILSAISSAILLYGLVIVYGFTGSTMLLDIADRVRSINLSADTPFGSNALMFGIVLIIAGFGFKIASVPFHMWAPDVYEGAPTPVTAFLSVASKAAGFAVILRVFYLAFGDHTLSVEWSAIFAIMSALSMSVGNLIAIRQDNIKRLLAYSTVAHAGYLMVGIAAVSATGAILDSSRGSTAVIFYLGGYAVTNLLAFSTIIAISNKIGSDMIDDFSGVAQRSPFLAACLGFALISLIGLPPTVGFVTKIYLFGAAIDANLEWLAVIGGINSVLSAYYYLRVVKVMYMSPAPLDHALKYSSPIKLAVLTTFGALLFFGIYPLPLLEAARIAANALMF